MNKKQAGIILTLMALIICTGILAAKVNGPIGDVGTTDLSALKNLKDTKQTSKSDYFTYAKAEKEQTQTRAIQTLKGIIDDKNTSKENKDKATAEFTKLTTDQKHANSIELSLKGKGYDDAICLIENNQARVFVKSKEKLTQKQTNQIQEVIVGISQIKDVIIEAKE
ncbi:stage III sporulation protein AH [Clostridium amylolyticum]|uniref:Stage III sporulation protein AH n=1 Tax=Clostridium amylolyticum TaxID=1121298 RepID=A0A1M6KHI0_9CLOT|nr:SpoIIIAH-like family protein [Clostridium amylolyticum]SHJ58389.1 stage III sporulation protein AH [Clostridium amylolyticum]